MTNPWRRLAAWGRRVYAAAKSGGAIGWWQTASQNVNTEISSSRVPINARVRQLVRDMPHAARAVDVLATWIVGPGLVLQSRIVGPDGKLDQALNRRIEDGWKWWADEADLAGRLHLHDLQSLAVRQLTEIGEFLLIKTATSAPGRYLPLALQIIEPDRLSEYAGTPLAGNEIHAGVEYDPRTGRSQAYWFADASPIGATTYGTSFGAMPYRSTRLPAYRVIHGFQSLRPGQLRGVSPFAPAVLLAHNLRDFLEAEIDGAKMAARWLAFIKSSDPAGTMSAFGVRADETKPSRKVEEIGTAIKEYLLPNEDVQLASHNRPGDAFTPFTRFVLRTFAATLGISYELLSGDYEGLNYSVLRGIRNDLSQQLATLRARFIRQFCVPVQREFMDWAVLTGRIELPGYRQNPWPYLRSVWLGPGMAPVDPLKEGRADLDAIGGRLQSPQETILSRGRDPEEVLDEIAEWQEHLDIRGLAAAPPTSPLKSNPAALEEEGDDRAGPARLRRVR